MTLSVREFDPKHVPRPSLPSSWNKIPDVLDVEIGCGVGTHALSYAKAHPERFLVAIEKSPVRFGTFRRHLSEHPSLPNLLPLHTNAISWITHSLGAQSVDRYFLLYPNPNPKKKHLNLRWHAMPFMHHMTQTLKSEGLLTLATNVEAYAQEASKYFREVWGLEALKSETIQQDTHPTFLPRTNFEKKYLIRGEICHNLVFQKP